MLNPITNQLDKVMLTLANTIIVFGIDNPDSSNYAKFKKEINAETAELQDAEGNTMTAAEAKAYVATLP